MEKPKRRIELNIEMNADSIDAAISELNHIIFEMRIRGEADMNTVSGGYSTGSIVNLKVNTEINHDNFIENLEKYLEEKKNEPPY